MKEIVKVLTLIMSLAVTILLIACFETPDQLDPDNTVTIFNRFYEDHKVQVLPPATPHVAATSTIEVPINPQRVIVFGHGDLDLFLSLGLANKVVGISVMGTMPNHLYEAFPVISLAEFNAGVNGVVGVSGAGFSYSGFPHDPNYDTVIALQPDLIIIEGRQRVGRGDSGHFQRLSAIAPTLDFGLTAGYVLRDTLKNLNDIARIFPDVAGYVVDSVNQIENQIAATKLIATTLQVRALMILKNDDSYRLHGAYGRWSMVFNELGLLEAIADLGTASHGAAMTESLILENANNIDIILIIDRNSDNPQNTILNHPLFENTSAIANNMVFMLSRDWYFAAGGIQLLLTQVAQIYDALNGFANHHATNS